MSVNRLVDGIHISFLSENGYPDYVVLCSQNGSRDRIHTITEKERLSGDIWLKTDLQDFYVKVFFQGEYGRVSNDAKRITR